ncbi:MAG: TonB-dependent receptor [Sphingobacteriales bacterium]|nr:MAG: TonB-dependent receptor [Sphingobacteriales bacterium]
MPVLFKTVALVLGTVGILNPCGAQDTCQLSLTLHITTPTHGAVWPATVYLVASGKSYEADSSGITLITGLCPGKHVFRVLTADYPIWTDSMLLTQSGERTLVATMPSGTLGEVVVEGHRVEVPVQINETLDETRLHAASGMGLSQALQQINGVTTVTNGATIAKTVIHGLSGNRVLTLNNGVRQEDQQWGGEHALAIDPAIAGSVTVIKGAAGVRYGTDAIAGVILVEPAPLRQMAGWEGGVALTAASNNRMGVLSGQVDHRFRKAPQLAFRLQGTLKAGGNYHLPSGAWAANTGIREAAYSATLDWRKENCGASVFYSRFQTELGLYRGSHTGSREDLLNAINSPEPLVPADFTYTLNRPRQRVDHQLVKARAFRETKLGTWSATYAYQHNFRQEYDVVRTPTDAAQLNLTLQTQTLNLNLDLRPKNGFSGTAGLDGFWQRNRFADGDRLFIPFYDALAGGAYAIGHFRKAGWELEAGVRGDLRQYRMITNQGSNQQIVTYNLDYQNLSGTAAVRRTVAKILEGSLTLSRAWRAPQANELFAAGLHQGAARIELGNPSLLPESATGLSAGLRSKGTHWQADISAYRQWINNFVYLQPGEDILTIRGYYKTFRYQQTDARLDGLDASVQGPVLKYLEASAKLSLVRSWDRVQQDWIILTPADRLQGGLRYQRDLGRWKRFFMGGTVAYVARQTRIPENFDAIDYPRPPADYTLVSATAGVTLPSARFPAQISLTADNLLNTRYRDYLDAFRYFLDQPGRNLTLRLYVPLGASN